MPNSVGLMAILISALRAEQVEAHHDPIWRNWYHGSLQGEALGKHKVRKKLARALQPVVPIDPTEVAKYAPKTPVKTQT